MTGGNTYSSRKRTNILVLDKVSMHLLLAENNNKEKTESGQPCDLTIYSETAKGSRYLLR
jgi:hypothetical protein